MCGGHAGWYRGNRVPTPQPAQAHWWGGPACHAVLTGTSWVITAHTPALKFRWKGIFGAVPAVLEDRCLRISSFPTAGRQCQLAQQTIWGLILETTLGPRDPQNKAHVVQGDLFTLVKGITYVYPRVSTKPVASLFFFFFPPLFFLLKHFCILQENFWSGRHSIETKYNIQNFSVPPATYAYLLFCISLY